MNQEEIISQIGAGATAGALLDALEPTIKVLERDAVSRLKSLYRSGNYTEVQLASLVAELCAIDNLVDNLRGKANAGGSARQRLEEVEL